LERIPGAAEHLIRISSDRALALELRRAAIELIGRGGFVDALPALSGLASRLEGQRSGQLSMTFAPRSQPEEMQLLPLLKEVLGRLSECE